MPRPPGASLASLLEVDDLRAAAGDFLITGRELGWAGDGASRPSSSSPMPSTSTVGTAGVVAVCRAALPLLSIREPSSRRETLPPAPDGPRRAARSRSSTTRCMRPDTTGTYRSSISRTFLTSRGGHRVRGRSSSRAPAVPARHPPVRTPARTADGSWFGSLPTTCPTMRMPPRASCEAIDRIWARLRQRGRPRSASATHPPRRDRVAGGQYDRHDGRERALDCPPDHAQAEGRPGYVT